MYVLLHLQFRYSYKIIFSFQDPEESVKEFMKNKPIMSEFDSQFKYYAVRYDLKSYINNIKDFALY